MTILAKLFNLGDIPYLLYPIVPLRWMYFVVRLEARLKYLLSRRDRRVVHGNLTTAFGDAKSQDEIGRLTRQFFEYKQLRALLLFLEPKLGSKQKDELFPIEGLENLDRALEEGKGAIVLGAHLNSVLMFAVKNLLRGKGYDVRIAVPKAQLPYQPSLFHRLVDRISPNGKREDVTAGLFYSQFNIRPIIRILEEKRVLGLMGDGAHSAGFTDVKFLGRSVLFTTGAMSIARMTQTPVVPMFITGAPPEGLKIIIEEPIPLEKSDDLKRDLQTMVSAFARRLEYHLLEDIPIWQHWLVDDVFESMATELDKPLGERYHV